MAKALKRIIVAQRDNVSIKDLKIVLKKTGDKIDLLANDEKGYPLRSFQKISASVHLDELLQDGSLFLYDENGKQITGLNPKKSTTLEKQRQSTNVLTGGPITYIVGQGLQLLPGNVLQSTGGGASGENAAHLVTQTLHGFFIGDVLRFDGTLKLYVKAKADTEANAEVVGIVLNVKSSSEFTLLNCGYISGMSGLVAGNVYFLSSQNEGKLTLIEPTATDAISKPCLIAISSTEGYFFNMRGALVGEAQSIPYVSTNPPPNPQDGDLWWDTDDNG